MKFAHLGDCHLGSWRIPELQQLNLDSFKKALEICIKEDVDFVLIAGDLFDSAYPPIEILKETFSEMKKLKDAGIDCLIIAGSHDFSASGKTFLDVLEKAGFCVNAHRPEEKDSKILLNPIICSQAAVYGYPGKKTGMEIPELRNIKLQDAPGYFKILMLHTSIQGAIGTLPIDSIKESELPLADYYALGHLHIDYQDGKFIYSGPIFPNNFQELEELKAGSFYIVNNGIPKRIELKIKEVEVLDMELKNALTATEQITLELGKRNLRNKILLVKLEGELEKGSQSNINFQEIEKYAKAQGAFAMLKSISQLSVKEEKKLELESADMEKIEEEIVKKYSKENPTDFSKFINSIIPALALEKQEDEKSTIFESRLIGELNKILSINGSN